MPAVPVARAVPVFCTRATWCVPPALMSRPIQFPASTERAMTMPSPVATAATASCVNPSMPVKDIQFSRSRLIATVPSMRRSSPNTGCTAITVQRLLMLPTSGREMRKRGSAMICFCRPTSTMRAPGGGGLAPQRMRPSRSTTMRLATRGYSSFKPASAGSQRAASIACTSGRRAIASSAMRSDSTWRVARSATVAAICRTTTSERSRSRCAES
jgi:hypothetical protein